MKTVLCSFIVSILFLLSVSSPASDRSVRELVAPKFEESAIPVPPGQALSWKRPESSLSEVFVSAAEALFRQGLADPRGCAYREISVGTGNCWNGDGGVVKTHGWVLPKTETSKYSFAVCWNGLVYPVVTVGEPADLRGDVLAVVAADEAMRAKHAKERPDWPFYRMRNAEPESRSVSHETIMSIKAVFVYRLGETELAEKLWSAWTAGMRPNINDDNKHLLDPYLMLATDWTWALFDRAACAHMRGDDRLALASARMLVPIWESVEKEATDRGFKPDDPHRNAQARHLAFIEPVHALLRDQERRNKQSKAPAHAGGRKTVAAMIEGLEDVSARQWGQPGGVSLGEDPRVSALAGMGDAAVEPLLACMESDERLTRSVHFWRDFSRHRTLIGVHEAAYVALVGILKTSFFSVGSTGDDLTSRGKEGRRAVAENIRAYWKRFKDVPIEERWYMTLANDGAPADHWLQAAGNITRPVDVEVTPSSMMGGWTSVPAREPGKVPPMSGERLRDKTGPSVAELMIRRVEGLSVSNIVSSTDMFQMHKACDMALVLAKWDPEAAVPVLKTQTRRCVELQSKGWNGNDWTSQRLARYAAQFTVILGRRGEEGVLDEYADWLQAQTPERVADVLDAVFQPVWVFPTNVALAKTAERMFNGESSPWDPLIAVSKRTSYRTRDLVGSAMMAVPAFRKQVLRCLVDTRPAGTVRVREPGSVDIKIDGGWSTSASFHPEDPLAPKEGMTQAIRLCDVYAHQLSSLEGTPGIEFFWPDARRDAAVRQSIATIERYGARYLEENGTFGLRLPRLGRTATKKDVEDGLAIFSLEGETRLWALPEVPMEAEWPSINMFPRCTSRWDPVTKKSRPVVYNDTGGKVWQAEEVLRAGAWKRFFGFVGRYGIAQVPAESVEFPGRWPWHNAGGGFDVRVSVSGSNSNWTCMTAGRAVLGERLSVHIALRNRRGVPQVLPATLYSVDNDAGPVLHSGVDIELKCLPGAEAAEELEKWVGRGVLGDFDLGEWKAVPSKRTSRLKSSGPGRVLESCEATEPFALDLSDWFDFKDVGAYRLRIAFTKKFSGPFDGKSGEVTFSVVPRGGAGGP